MTDDKANKGLRIEHAASVTLRDLVAQHMHAFAHVIQRDRVAGQAVVAAYIDGLAGAMALVVSGRQGTYEDVVRATQEKLRESVNRDLVHLGRQRNANPLKS